MNEVKMNHSNGLRSQENGSRPEDLPNLLGNAGDEEDPLAAMRGKPEYAELIRELEIIAQAARDMFSIAAEEPSERVWHNISNNLNAKPDA